MIIVCEQRLRGLIFTILALLMCVSLAGCGGTSSAKGVSSRGSEAFTQDTVRLASSQMRALTDIQQRTHSAMIADIMKDGVITAQEMNDLQRQQMDCYAAAGYDILYDDDLTATVIPRDANAEGETEDVARKCDTNQGFADVYTIYFEALRNPDARDLTSATIQCLIDKGLVDKTYTKDEYERDSENRTGPYTPDPETGGVNDQVYTCGRDPLGNLQ